MKTLKYKNRIFQYEIISSDMIPETMFYDGVETVTRKKYYIFGKDISYTKPKYVFSIYVNIEDPRRDKASIRGLVGKQVSILERREEILNGDII